MSKELTLQQIVCHYADRFLDKAAPEDIDKIRKHGAHLIHGDVIDPCALFEARDILHVVLDPAYAVTRARFDVTHKLLLEDGICRRIWNLCYERTWASK